MNKQDGVMKNIDNELDDKLEGLPVGMKSIFMNKFEPKLKEIDEKNTLKELDIQNKYLINKLPLEYYKEKIALEANYFKEQMQYKTKYLKEILDYLHKNPEYPEEKKEQDLKFTQKSIEDVRLCRQEKKDLEAFNVSRLESPAELAQSLSDEMGPDYTGVRI